MPFAPVVGEPRKMILEMIKSISLEDLDRNLPGENLGIA